MYKFISLLFLVTSSFSYGANLKATGTIGKIKTFSFSCSSFPGECERISGSSWIRIDGVSELGDCPIIGSNGLILYIPKEDHFIFSSALNAKTNNLTVTIGVNDVERFHNGCKVDNIEY